MNSVKNRPKGLGRGLDAIFEIEDMVVQEKTKKSSSMDELDIDKIVPNPNQPRTLFDEEALSELCESIKAVGLIQPITVREEKNGTYTIISGERRYRASRMAGLPSIPVYIRKADDNAMLEMALVENIQRQDLNAIDVAMSLQRLIDECGLTQDALADRVGKKRSTVANYVRLLKLPAELQLAIREELISMGHARALISMEDRKQQVSLLKRIVKNHLSVRQVEELVKNLSPKPLREKTADEEYPETYIKLVEHLEKFFAQEISIRKNKKGEGRIVIGFKTDGDIESIVSKFETLNAL